MSELSLKVSQMQASNEQAGALGAEAHFQAKEISPTKSNSDGRCSDPKSDSGSKTEEGEPNNTEIATNNFIGDLAATDEEAYFITGSTYDGSWDALGMAGVGRYVMPNGAAYEGEIRDGMFDGRGSIYWPENQRLDVVHLRGVLQEAKYTFADGLAYRNADWDYCKFPDRRFHESIKRGLRPGGRGFRTAKQPTKILSCGCYDVGDGIFDPNTFCVTSYDDSSQVLRVPTRKECDWIVKNCRKSWTEPTGYPSSLNEISSKDPPRLPYNLAMSKDSPDSWWKRVTTFERDLVEYDEEQTVTGKRGESGESSELHICGRYMLLGESCQCMVVPTPSKFDWFDNTDRRFYGEGSKDYFEDDDIERRDVTLTPDSATFTSAPSIYTFRAIPFDEFEISNSESEADASAASSSMRCQQGLGVRLEVSLEDQTFVQSTEDICDETNWQPEDIAKRKSQRQQYKYRNFDEEENAQVAMGKSYSEGKSSEEEAKSLESHQELLEYHDYGRAATIPEEKVPVTEPEASTGRGTEPGLVPKVTATEEYRDDNIPMESESIEESSGRVLQLQGVKAEAITSDGGRVAGVAGTSEKLEESTEIGTECKKPPQDEILKENVVDGAENELGTKSRTEEGATGLIEDGDSKTLPESQFIDSNEETVEEKLKGTTEKLEEALKQNIVDGLETELGANITTEEGVAEGSAKSDFQLQPVEKEAITSGGGSIAETTSKASRDKMSTTKMMIEGVAAGSSEDRRSKISSKSQLIYSGDATSKGILKGSMKSSKSLLISRTRQTSRDLTTEEAKTVRVEVSKTCSKNLDEEGTRAYSLTSSKEDSQGLENVHPSLASLSPSEEEAFQEKQIIEIYNKVPRKDKPEKRCSKTNVWSLSSAMRKYNSLTKTPCQSCGLQRKTNTADLPSGLTFEAPKSRPDFEVSTSRPDEYARRICTLEIRKPATQEVVVPVASPYREKYSVKFPPKPNRITALYSRGNSSGKK